MLKFEKKKETNNSIKNPQQWSQWSTNRAYKFRNKTYHIWCSESAMPRYYPNYINIVFSFCSFSLSCTLSLALTHFLFYQTSKTLVGYSVKFVNNLFAMFMHFCLHFPTTLPPHLLAPNVFAFAIKKTAKCIFSK